MSAGFLVPSKRPEGSEGVGTARRPKPEFKLTRYFSITSLIGVLVILVALLVFYRYFAFHALMEHETRGNIALTRVFANTIWPNHAAYVKDASATPKSELPQRPEIVRLREDVLRQMNGLNVVKVKIYNLDGLTAFSTDPKQIGEDKSANAGFLQAKAGEPASEITFRNRFDAFEQEIVDRNLVSSYVPIRKSESSPVEGVMEVYSDVTEFVARLERTQWEIVGSVLGSLSLLYLFLFAIVRRADRLIGAQSAEVRVAHEAVLRNQAYHDSLTGLPNLANFSERLHGMIHSARRSETKCAVLSLDLDGFKNINDSLGHMVGDRLLKDVGRRLKACLRESDVTARFGGDEFLVALSGFKAVEQIVNTAEKVLRTVSDPSYAIDGHNLTVTTSIGIAIFPENGADVAELIKSADAATHHAKKVGRNNYQFHTADMNARALNMLTMERALRQALERDEFFLHYQPQLDVRTGKIVGAEALIRWRHPEKGMVPPAQFIPIAEERGLIVPIGDWVLREACRQNKEWQRQGLPAFAVAVNLSALQFEHKDLSRKVAGVLQDCGLAPEYLELELTESAVMRDAETTIFTMRMLKDIGIRLSLDDFGTGYSSLSQLKRFPLDKLKIDQSFVRGLPHDPDDLAIATAIIGMGHALGQKVIAEGVETEEQRDFLQSHGCDEIQGYLLAEPSPALEFAQYAIRATTELARIAERGMRIGQADEDAIDAFNRGDSPPALAASIPPPDSAPGAARKRRSRRREERAR